MCAHITDRCDHISASYGDNVLILGGYDSRTHTWIGPHSMDIYSPWLDLWSSQKCTGPGPPRIVDYICTAQVVGHHLYLIWCPEKIPSQSAFISTYALDLKSFRWQRLEDISGLPPMTVYKASSWRWQDRIYIFAGAAIRPNHVAPEQCQASLMPDAPPDSVVTNQCVALNTSTLSWEWPRCSGEAPPSPRKEHKCLITGDHMLVFGGFRGTCGLSDLHALHMPTHRWTCLQGGDSPEAPRPQQSYSFTLVSENRALLFSGSLGCWVCAWTVDRRGIHGVKWTSWGTLSRDNVLNVHQAICSRDTSKLYLMGKAHEGNREVISVLVNPPSLLEACMSAVEGRHIKAALQAVAIPQDLREFLVVRLKLS